MFSFINVSFACDKRKVGTKGIKKVVRGSERR